MIGRGVDDANGDDRAIDIERATDGHLGSDPAVYVDLDNHPLLDDTAASPQQNQRAVAMVVRVADGHRRSVHHEGGPDPGLFEQHFGLEQFELEPHRSQFLTQ